MNDMSARESGPPSADWRELRRDDGFAALIGPLWFLKEADGVVFGFRAEAKHCNVRGVVHGGMLMTFLDHALGAHIWRLGNRAPSVTVSLATDFIASARSGDWVEARSRVSKRGTGLVFASGELTADGRPIATAQGVWKILAQR
jgi:acyl-coenzyme A thioesterase PaaI-like protein